MVLFRIERVYAPAQAQRVRRQSVAIYFRVQEFPDHILALNHADVLESAASDNDAQVTGRGLDHMHLIVLIVIDESTDGRLKFVSSLS